MSMITCFDTGKIMLPYMIRAFVYGCYACYTYIYGTCYKCSHTHVPLLKNFIPLHIIKISEGHVAYGDRIPTKIWQEF